MADKTSAKETLRQHFIEEGYSEDKDSSGRFFTKTADNGDLKRVFIAITGVVMWTIDAQTSTPIRDRHSHDAYIQKLDL
jgi:hypothetical protein|tara:strand:+ start:120881 stop:121117 length:237 start_codon:yes stop_codon:yes gene_type:complete